MRHGWSNLVFVLFRLSHSIFGFSSLTYGACLQRVSTRNMGQPRSKSQGSEETIETQVLVVCMRKAPMISHQAQMPQHLWIWSGVFMNTLY